MFNPILSELLARERYNDHLRQAGRSRRAKAAIARQMVRRVDPRASLGNLLIAVRHLFKALARAS